jgi:hypothetical protein
MQVVLIAIDSDRQNTLISGRLQNTKAGTSGCGENYISALGFLAFG